MITQVRLVDDSREFANSACRYDKTAPAGNNRNSKARTSKLADASFREGPERDFVESERGKSLRRTNGRRKAMEPICSVPPFSIPPPPLLLSLFLSRFSTHRPNLCYLLVTFIWSPRVLDLSPGLLSSLTLPRPFFPSSSPPAFVPSLAIAY